MLVSEAIERIRRRINDEYDTGYSDEVLINYINDSIKYLCHALITRNDPLLVDTMEIKANEINLVPANFTRFAGGYPVKRMGNRFYLTDGSDYLTAKYFFIPAELTAVTDDLPFDNDTYHALIINLSCIYALNQHEFNVERDTAMKQEMEQLITQALGEVG